MVEGMNFKYDQFDTLQEPLKMLQSTPPNTTIKFFKMVKMVILCCALCTTIKKEKKEYSITLAKLPKKMLSACVSNIYGTVIFGKTVNDKILLLRIISSF
jgi:hypothetical protein